MPEIQGIGPILADLDRHAHVFDLDRDHLAEWAHSETVAQIAEEMDAQIDPDGNSWDELSDAYEKWKSSAYPGLPIGELLGLMKDAAHLFGLYSIHPDRARFTYGTEEEARNHAQWFQDPDNPNQPPRKFYALSAECKARLTRFFDDHLARNF